MDDIAVIIPALESNVYHQDGDLAPFGDMSLFEWKLTQVNRLVPQKQIYVTSPSDRIRAITESNGSVFIQRKDGLTINRMIVSAISEVRESTVLWTYATSPYVGSKDYDRYIECYRDLETPYDSLATTFSMSQYTFFSDRPLNFDMKAIESRRNLDPVRIITNGCFIIARDLAIEVGGYYGNHPYLCDVDRLTSMEVKTFDDLAIANDLITLYFKTKG